jgi:hypothetical protein
MPEYLYQHPNTKEVMTLLQKMTDEHEFIDTEGIKWQRLFGHVGLSMDSQAIDPFSEKQFLEKTANMKGTMGDMMDYSKELSSQREATLGKEDPIKRKAFNEYKKTRGVSHPNDRPKSAGIETSKYKVDF